MSDVIEPVETQSMSERIKQKITGIISYLLPLVASMPPMTAWATLMTVPFAIYLIMILFNFTDSSLLPDLMNPQVLLTTIFQLASIVLLLCSIVHLRKMKSAGLVTSGPYRIVRHPQYFALILFTLPMTYSSIWILQHTFGIGWLSVDQTKILWILMLGVYAIIAKIEESHLEKTFESDWKEYKSVVGFLIPLARFKSHLIEMLSAVLIPYAILEIVLYLSA